MITDAAGEREAKIPLVIIRLIKVLRGATLADLQAICREYITVPVVGLSAKQVIIR
jgi:hypothetical protein